MGDAGQIAGAAITSAANIGMNSENNRTQQELAQKSMDFSERMSSTAYQRATADMKASGINPMAAYMKGGASSPQGQIANTQPGKIDGQTVSTAMDTVRLNNETKQAAANTAYTDARTLTELERVKTEKEEAKNKAVEALNAQKDLPLKEKQRQLEQINTDWDKWYSGWDHTIRRVKEFTGTITNALTGAHSADALDKKLEQRKARGKR